MTDAERDRKFQADFARLKANREKVPLEQLQGGRYKAAYEKLVREVLEGADWFAGWYLTTFGSQKFPISPLDPEGNAWLMKRLQEVVDSEKHPGGRIPRYRAALIERLDMEEYENMIAEILARMEQEAFYVYWMRHCFNRSGYIWNDIFSCWWRPKREGGTPGDGTGCWYTKDGKVFSYEYPPREKAKVAAMPICKGCGRPILWTKTETGKSMPLDPEWVPYWRKAGAKGKLLTDQRKVESIEFSGEGKAHGIGWVPHWVTCPKREDFRREKKEGAPA